MANLPTRSNKETLNKNQSKNNKPWNERFTITKLMVGTVLSFIIIGGLISSGLALNEIYEQKSKDTWALIFLDLERMANNLSQNLETIEDTTNRTNNAQSIYKLMRLRVNKNEIQKNPRTKLSLVHTAGPRIPIIKISDLGVKLKNLSTKNKGAIPNIFTQIAGRTYRVDRTGNKIIITPFNVQAKIKAPEKFNSESHLYLVNRSQTLVYQTSQIGEAWLNRPLIQKYISAPLWQGQFEYRDPETKSLLHGFFQEIPGTNLVLFAEVPVSVVLQTIVGPSQRFAWVLGLILIITTVLLWFPVHLLSKPVQELQEIAKQVGRGNFEIKTSKSFGEFQELFAAFTKMAGNLKTRDELIHRLAKEETEKVRLESELQLASSLQQNFLPQSDLPSESNISTGTFYQSATEVAGDWYGYQYDAYSENTCIVVVDVAGHGAASCMLTAMIAGFFSKTCKKVDYESLTQFLHETNTAMIALGARKWHATAIACLYQKKLGKITFINAGHQFPFVIIPGDNKSTIHPISLRSAPLGIDKILDTSEKELTFPSGSKAILFTDGLVEAFSPLNKPYGRKRVSKIFKEHSTKPITQIVRSLHGDWESYLGSNLANDDTCIVGLEAA